VSGQLALCGSTLAELERLLSELREPAYRARQVFRQIYVRQEADPSRMSDLPTRLRSALTERCRTGLPTIDAVHPAGDGSRKLVFGLEDGRRVEGVLLPGQRHGSFTQCVSTQVGCTFDCEFCLTGRLGILRNLEVGEIVGQLIAARRYLAEEDLGVGRLVFMGMGEPLANYGALVAAIRLLTDPAGVGLASRRLTVSTAGVPRRIPQLGRETDVCLAVSLNATTDDLRARLMPRAHDLCDLAALLATCEAFPTGEFRRLTFEYVLLDSVNDGPEDARRLAGLLGELRAKVNLIPFNPWKSPAGDVAPFARPPMRRVDAFAGVLSDAGLPVTVRVSRGTGIQAACGQLGGEPTE